MRKGKVGAKHNILLVEDEENFGVVLKSYLELSDYKVTLCDNGNKGLAGFKSDQFDLCILDVMMPEMDGYTLAREIRSMNTEVPLIFLTAKSMKEDMVQGFKIGADDYITKPFDSEVLLYKIKAILKRGATVQQKEVTEFDIGVYHFNYKLRTVELNGNSQKLSPKESELLKLLCEFMNDVMPRELALNKIWEDSNYFTTRSMDVFVTKLRKYLSEDPRVQIENVHGNGFRLFVKS
jgi:two-component system OmpR family response regulator